MDPDIKELMEYEIEFQQSRIEYIKYGIKELKSELSEHRKMIRDIKRKARRQCHLNKECRNWQGCWKDGKMKCKGCSAFETTEQYEKRMKDGSVFDNY